MLPSGRWALTPPFHPYQALPPSAIRFRGLLSGCPKVFLQMATEALCTGGLFSVALSVAKTSSRLRELHEESAPWRYQARCPLVRGAPRRRLQSWHFIAQTSVPDVRREDHGVRTFLPARPLARAGPAITRPARQFQYIISHRVIAVQLRRKNTQKYSSVRR